MKPFQHALAAALICSAAQADTTILNASFESPDAQARSNALALPANWQLFTSSSEPVEVGVIAAEASKGEQSLALKSTPKAGAFYGLLQVIDVSPGKSVTLDADVRNDPSDPLSGTVSGQLSFEWLKGDEEVGRSYSGDWKQSLSADKWTTMTLAATAPDTADRVRVVITLRNGDRPTGGAFLIDNLRLSASAE